MPRYEVKLSDGRVVTLEADSQPKEEEILAAIQQHEQQQRQDAETAGPPPPPPDSLGALKTFGEQFALGVPTGAAARYGFRPGMALGALATPASMATGPGAFIPPMAGGFLTSAGAAIGTDILEQKALGAIAPEYQQRVQQRAQEHPWAALAGRTLSLAPSFKFGPLKNIKALMGLTPLAKGSEREAAVALGTGLGLQAAILTGETALSSEHRLPTLGELGESALQFGLYHAPRGRAELPLPQSLEKGVSKFYARENRPPAEVHGDVRTQPKTGLPTQERRPRVLTRTQEEAERLGEETPVPLNPNIPQITGSEATGFTLRYQGGEESGFKTMADVNKAIEEVASGKRKLGTPEAAPTPEPKPTPAPEIPTTITPEIRKTLADRGFPEDVIDTMDPREAGLFVEQGFTPDDYHEVRQRQGEAMEQGAEVGMPGEMSPNEPFAPGSYFQATGDGFKIFPREFAQHVVRLKREGFTSEEISRNIRARVEEESYHNYVMKFLGSKEAESLINFWRNKTTLEQRIALKIYRGHVPESQLRGINEINAAHEVIRRYLQEAAGTDVSELTETKGLEKLNLRALMALEKIIEGTRAMFGSEFAKYNQHMHQTITRSLVKARTLAAVREAAQKEQQAGPYAQQREPGEQSFGEFYMHLTRLYDSHRVASETLQNKMKQLGIPIGARARILMAVHGFAPEDKSREIIDGLPFELRALGKNVYDLNRRVVEASKNPMVKHAEDLILQGSETSLGGEPGPGVGPNAMERRKALADFIDRDKWVHGVALKAWQDLQKVMSEGKQSDLLSPYIHAPSYSERIEEMRTLRDNPNLYPPARPLVNRLLSADLIIDKMLRSPLYEDAASIRAQGKAGYPMTGAGLGPNAMEREEGVMPVAYRPGRPAFRPEPRPVIPEGPAGLERFRKDKRKLSKEEQEKLQGQQQMFAPPPGGDKPPPPPTPFEERGAPPGLPQRPDIAQIRQGAQDVFEGRAPLTTTGLEFEPDFRSFYDWVKSVNPRIDSQHAMQIWADTVIHNIEGATGEQLSAIVKRLKVGNRVYPWEKVAGKTIYHELPISNEEQIPLALHDLPDDMRETVIASTMRNLNMSRAEATEYLTSRRTRALSKRRIRDKALAAVFYKLVVEPLERPVVPVDRSDVTVDDLGWSNPNTKEGVWRTIRPDERNIPALRKIMGDEAIRFSFDPSNHTRRTLVLRNKRSGEVAFVSGYNVTGDVNVMEPSGGVGRTGYPNVKLSTLLGEWDPILSGLLGEPIKDFRKIFRDIDEFNRYIGRDAERTQQHAVIEELGFPGEFDRGDIPEWMAMAYEEGPRMLDVQTESGVQEVPYDLVQQMHQGFGGRPPVEEETTYRPGTMVTEGEGGDFIGPYKGQFSTRPGQLLKNAPLQAHEIMALVDWIHDPGAWSHLDVQPGGVTSEADMMRAIAKLADLAQTGHKVVQPRGPEKLARGLAPKQLSAVVALRKAMAEQYRRDLNEWPQLLREEQESLRNLPSNERAEWLQIFKEQMEPTPERSGEIALRRLYGLIKEYNAQDAARHISAIMAEFSRPTPKPKGSELTRILARLSPPSVTGPVFQEPPDIALPGPEVQGPRPLVTGIPEGKEKPTEEYFPTMYITGPPTTPSEIGGAKFKPERGIPKAHEGAQKPLPHETAIQVKEASIARLRDEGPAASIRELRENVKRRFEEIDEIAKRFTSIPRDRRTTFHDINAALDGADRLVEWYGNSNAFNVKLASVKGPQDIGRLKKLWYAITRGPGQVFETPEARMVRRSAKAVIAARQDAYERAWMNYWDDWQAKLREYGRQEDVPANERPRFHEPTTVSPDNFDRWIIDVKEGIRRANESRESPFPQTRMNAAKWLRAAKSLMEELEYGRRHYNDQELTRTADVFENVMAEHLKNMNARGLPVTGRDFYVPNRYEGELWVDGRIQFGSNRVLGTQFRLPRTFANYYDAIKTGPYIPVNTDIADLAQHSLVAGGRIMAREAWLNGLKKVIDPVSKKPVAIEPEWGISKPVDMSLPAFDAWYQEIRKTIDSGKYVPQEIINKFLKEAGVTEAPWSFKVPKGQLDYDLVYPTRRSKPLAVRVGYKSMVESGMAESQIRKIPVLREALYVEHILKNGLVLILDTFHPDRLAQYSMAIRGGNPLGRGGISALQYDPESLPEAVRVGAISQRQANWAVKPITLYDRGQPKTMTRQTALRTLSTRGLNATMTSDTLYRDAIRNLPIIGEAWHRALTPANKWIFDQFTPGIIAESAVRNLERYSAKNKHLSLDAQVREIVRDLNVYYGNLGRNGIFKNPTARDAAALFLLAPMWQEGLVGKELRVLSRLTGVSRLLGRKGLGTRAYFGPLTSGLLWGLGTYFALTQLINLITRQKFTFQNPEPGHELDAWIPLGGTNGLWLSPMSVFGEVAHDIWRLAETKPKTWDALTQVGRNKLGPMGRLIWILAEGRTPAGEDISTSGGVLSKASQELLASPISVGTYAKAAASKMYPEGANLPMIGGMFSPPRPGQVAQRAISAIGIKTQLANRPEVMVKRLASDFVKKNKLRFEPMQFSPTDQGNYSKLRSALRNGDTVGARKVFNEIREYRTDQQILDSMERASRRPFTGSDNNEQMFLYSLKPEQMELYFRANLERAEDYQRFLQFYMSEPQR